MITPCLPSYRWTADLGDGSDRRQRQEPAGKWSTTTVSLCTVRTLENTPPPLSPAARYLQRTRLILRSGEHTVSALTVGSPPVLL